MSITNAEEIARISGALVAALMEAKVMAEAGNFGVGLADLLQHARELHELIGEELTIAGDAVGEYAGGLYHAMGERLKDLEGLVRLRGH